MNSTFKLCGLAVALLPALLLSCVSRTKPLPLQVTGHSTLAQIKDDVGNIVAGAKVTSANEAEFDRVIGDSIAWSDLKEYEDYELRAYLPYKLRDIEWDRGLLLIEFKGIGGSERSPFHHVLEQRLFNNNPEVGKLSQMTFSFGNFGDAGGVGETALYILSVPDALLAGGLITEMVTGKSHRETWHPVRMSNFKPAGMTAGIDGTVRLSHDGYDSWELLDYKLIEKWREDHEFTALQVTHHFYAAVISGTRPYNCRTVEKTRQNGNQIEVYREKECDTWIDYRNPPRLMAQGQYQINF